MKILIVSDTHGQEKNLEEVLEKESLRCCVQKGISDTAFPLFIEIPQNPYFILSSD